MPKFGRRTFPANLRQGFSTICGILCDKRHPFEIRLDLLYTGTLLFFESVLVHRFPNLNLFSFPTMSSIDELVLHLHRPATIPFSQRRQASCFLSASHLSAQPTSPGPARGCRPRAATCCAHAPAVRGLAPRAQPSLGACEPFFWPASRPRPHGRASVPLHKPLDESSSRQPWMHT